MNNSIKENINEARITEGANPVSNAYNHKITIPETVTIPLKKRL